MLYTREKQGLKPVIHTRPWLLTPVARQAIHLFASNQASDPVSRQLVVRQIIMSVTVDVSSTALPSWWPPRSPSSATLPCTAYKVLMRGCGCIRQPENDLTVHTEHCIRDQDSDRSVASSNEAEERNDCLKTNVVYATASELCPNCAALHDGIKFRKSDLKLDGQNSVKLTKKWFKNIFSSSPASSPTPSPWPLPAPAPEPKVAIISKKIYSERFLFFSLKVRDQAKAKAELKRARSSIIKDAWATHAMSERARDPACTLEKPRVFEDPEDDEILPPSLPVLDEWCVRRR